MRILTVALVTVASLGACSRPAGAPPGPAATVTPTAIPAAKAKVARVVFVGQQNACDCTRKAIDASWQALAAVLGPENRLPIERLQADTQEAQVAPYRARRPFFTAPAIYVLDETDGLVELFQGAVTEAQLRPVLASAAQAPKEKRP